MSKERYFVLKQAGICVDCKKRPAIPDRVLCRECRDRRWEKYHNGRIRKSDVWRAAGLCIRCGGVRIKDRMYCESCYKAVCAGLAKAQAQRRAARIREIEARKRKERNNNDSI